MIFIDSYTTRIPVRSRWRILFAFEKISEMLKLARC